jgi:phosphatidylglycerophosphate synthase
VAVLFLNQLRLDVKPSIVGKLTTASQALLIVITLASGYIQWASWVLPGIVFLTLLLTVLSGLHYIYSGLRIIT